MVAFGTGTGPKTLVRWLLLCLVWEKELPPDHGLCPELSIVYTSIEDHK